MHCPRKSQQEQASREGEAEQTIHGWPRASVGGGIAQALLCLNDYRRRGARFRMAPAGIRRTFQRKTSEPIAMSMIGAGSGTLLSSNPRLKVEDCHVLPP